MARKPLTTTVSKPMAVKPVSSIQQALFWVIALTWLPAGIFLTALIRFGLSVFEDKGGDGEILLLAISAACGLFLALACGKLWRHGRKISVYICALILGPISILGVLIAGLLGPLMMLAYAMVISLPAWLLVFIFYRRSKQHGN